MKLFFAFLLLYILYGIEESVEDAENRLEKEEAFKNKHDRVKTVEKKGLLRRVWKGTKNVVGAVASGVGNAAGKASEVTKKIANKASEMHKAGAAEKDDVRKNREEFAKSLKDNSEDMKKFADENDKFGQESAKKFELGSGDDVFKIDGDDAKANIQLSSKEEAHMATEIDPNGPDKYWWDFVGLILEHYDADEHPLDANIVEMNRLRIFTHNDLRNQGKLKKCLSFSNIFRSETKILDIKTVEDKITNIQKSVETTDVVSGGVSFGLASAQAMMKNSVKKTEAIDTKNKKNVNTVTQEYKMINRRYFMHDDCWRWLIFNMDFLVEYEMLPFSIKTPSDRESYRLFIANIGVNVLQSITVGQSYTLTMESTTSEETGQKKTKSDACKEATSQMAVTVAGVGAKASTSFGSCNSASEASKDFKGTANTNMIIKVRGGKNADRAAVLAGRDAGAIRKWAKSGDDRKGEGDKDKFQSMDIIDLKLSKIWSLLQRIFPKDSPHWIRAENLKSVYTQIQWERLQGAPLPSCAQIDTFVYDPDQLIITLTDIATPLECYAKCQDSKLCRFWDQHLTKQICRMYKIDNPITASTTDYYVSGPDLCEPDLGNIPECAKTGLFILGTKTQLDYTEINSPSAEICQKFCFQAGSCRYWNFYLSKERDSRSKYFGKSSWKCILFKELIRSIPLQDKPFDISVSENFSIVGIKQSITGPRTCHILITEESPDNTIEMQYGRVKRSKNPFDVQHYHTYSGEKPLTTVGFSRKF